MKLAVGYPWSSEFIFTQFADHLPNLERPEGGGVRVFRGKGWCPARRHVDLCEQAVKWGADLICIIGADQVHPSDLLPRLYKLLKQILFLRIMIILLRHGQKKLLVQHGPLHQLVLLDIHFINRRSLL